MMKLLITEALELIENANKIANSDADWGVKYDLIFSDSVSMRLRQIFTELNFSFDYYDPDCDYSDDVLAYIRALNEHSIQLRLVNESLQ